MLSVSEVMSYRDSTWHSSLFKIKLCKFNLNIYLLGGDYGVCVALFEPLTCASFSSPCKKTTWIFSHAFCPIIMSLIDFNWPSTCSSDADSVPILKTPRSKSSNRCKLLAALFNRTNFNFFASQSASSSFDVMMIGLSWFWRYYMSCDYCLWTIFLPITEIIKSLYTK